MIYSYLDFVEGEHINKSLLRVRVEDEHDY